MHYAVMVLTETLDTSEVEEQLAPFDENLEGVGETHWDWWQFGGRYTGFLDPDYRPEQNPDNWEKCRYCDENGIVNFREGNAHWQARLGQPCHHGTADWSEFAKFAPAPGLTLKWPTQWANYDGDVRPVRDLPDTDDVVPYALVVDGIWRERGEPPYEWYAADSGYTEEDRTAERDRLWALWVNEFRDLLQEYPDHFAWIVDCHS